MYSRKITLILAYIFLVCVMIAIICNKNRQIASQQAQLNRIPTIREFQTLLGCKKIDGKLGPCWTESETQTLWDLKICNDYALPSFNKNFYEVRR